VGTFKTGKDRGGQEDITTKKLLDGRILKCLKPTKKGLGRKRGKNTGNQITAKTWREFFDDIPSRGWKSRVWGGAEWGENEKNQGGLSGWQNYFNFSAEPLMLRGGGMALAKSLERKQL